MRTLLWRLFLCGVAMAMLGLGGLLVTAGMVTATPGWYADAAIDNDAESDRFEQTLAALVLSCMPPEHATMLLTQDADHFPEAMRRKLWVAAQTNGLSRTQTLTQSEINAWIRDQSSVLQTDDVSDARIILSENMLTLACRMKTSAADAVISIDLEPSVQNEEFRFAVQALRVGHLPLPSEQILRLLDNEADLSGSQFRLDTRCSPPEFVLDAAVDAHLRFVTLKVTTEGLQLTVEPVEADQTTAQIGR